MNTSSTFGQLIRSRRKDFNISLRELARNIKISAAFLSDIELGRRSPSDEVKNRLLNSLEIKQSSIPKVEPVIQLVLPDMLTEDQIAGFIKLGVDLLDWNSMAIMPEELYEELNGCGVLWDHTLHCNNVKIKTVSVDGSQFVIAVAYN